MTLRTRAQVAKEIRMVTASIRDLCANINHEADDMAKGHMSGWASPYIDEKAETLKWRANELHRLNEIVAKAD